MFQTHCIENYTHNTCVLKLNELRKICECDLFFTSTTVTTPTTTIAPINNNKYSQKQ